MCFSPAAHVIEFSDKLFVLFRHGHSGKRRHGIQLSLLTGKSTTALPLSSDDADQLGRCRSERFIPNPIIHGCYRILEGNRSKDNFPCAFQLRSDFFALEYSALVREVEKEILKFARFHDWLPLVLRLLFRFSRMTLL